MSIREAALPLANDGVDDIFSQAASETASFAPSFREAWRPLFAEDRYQHMLPAIHVFCWVPAFYFLCSFSWRCHSGLHYRESAKEFAKERSVWLATLLSDTPYPPGEHQVAWQPRDLAAGLYLCRFQVGSFTATATLVRLR